MILILNLNYEPFLIKRQVYILCSSSSCLLKTITTFFNGPLVPLDLCDLLNLSLYDYESVKQKLSR